MQGAQSANPIVASGHVPHQKAEYMTAPDFSAQAAEKTLQRGGRPYMTIPAVNNTLWPPSSNHRQD